jgi:hypothetical protein
MMTVEGVREWLGGPVARRYAPAAGSVVVHGVVLAAIAVFIGAGIGNRLATPVDEDFLRVEMIEQAERVAAEALPPVVAPRPPAPPRAGDTTIPKKPGATTTTPVPGAPVVGATDDADDGVYLGDGIPGVKGPPGLAGLMTADPCAVKVGVKPKECASNWAAKVGTMDTALPRSKAEMEKYYAEFMPRCMWSVGCEPGERINPSGTRPPPRQSAASAGAAQLGGLHDSVGRLEFNPDHYDRGFGD